MSRFPSMPPRGARPSSEEPSGNPSAPQRGPGETRGGTLSEHGGITEGAPVLEAAPLDEAAPAIDDDTAPFEPGDARRYVLEEEIGRGALGRVWAAIDARLHRYVAIKEHIGGTSSELRFRREARVTARLEHPSIVPVYDVGTWTGGRPFYSMKLVSGRTLRDAIDAAPDLEARIGLLPHVLAVADAMAYAHSHSVIHRDLKPQNILIGEFGETMVVDWGLAKVLGAETDAPPGPEDAPRSDSRPGETQAGTVLGTPAYMAPEQARGEPVGEQADVYALGAILYHLLAGVPPFAGASTPEVLGRVLSGELEPLESREPRIPHDLAGIVRCAMARAPSDRYRTARELAEDLKRFQRGQMVSAYAYTPLMRVSRWVRQHRGAMTVGLVSLVLLAGLGVVSVARIVEERDFAEAERRRLTLVQAETSLDRDPTAALGWLKTFPIDQRPEDEDRVRAIAADAQARGVSLHVLPGDGMMKSARFSPDGRVLATASDRGVSLFDAETGRFLAERRCAHVQDLRFLEGGRAFATRGRDGVLTVEPGVDDAGQPIDGEAQSLQGHEGPIQGLEVLDAERFVSAGEEGSVWLWVRGPSGRYEGTRLGRHDAPANEVAVSPDGARVASAATDGVVLVFDLRRGTSRRLKAHDAPVWAVAFSSDGRWLATGSEDTTAHLYSVADLDARPQILRGHTDGIGIVTFTPDGKTLVTAGLAGGLRLWDVQRGQGRALVGHTQAIDDVEISRDGLRLASAGLDGVVRLWDLRSFVSKPLVGHRNLIERLHLSPDETRLVSASQDGTARVWVLPPLEARTLSGHVGDIDALRFDPSGRMLASSGEDRLLRLWDLERGTAQVLSGPRDHVWQIVFSTDGRWVAASGYDSEVRVWPLSESGLADAAKVRVLAGHTAQVMRLGFLPELPPHPPAIAAGGGPLLVSGGNDGLVRLWNVETSSSTILQRHTKAIYGTDVAPDGRRVAAGGMDNMVRLTDLETGELREFTGPEDVVHRVGFSPDGRVLWAASWDGTVRTWDLETGRNEVLRGHRGRVRAIAMAPDGASIASGGDDQRLIVWDRATGHPRMFGRHDAYIRNLAYSPDGRLIATQGWDQTVRLWDVRAGVLLGMTRHLSANVHAIAFSPDAGLDPPRGRLASGGTSGVVELPGIRHLAQLPTTRSALRGWLDRTTTAVVTDGALHTPVAQ